MRHFSLLTLLAFTLTTSVFLFLNFPQTIPYVVVENHDELFSAGIGDGRVIKSVEQVKIAHRIHFECAGWPFEIYSYNTEAEFDARVPNSDAAFARVRASGDSVDWDFESPVLETDFLVQWPQAKNKILDDYQDLAGTRETHARPFILNLLIAVVVVAATSILIEFRNRRSGTRSLASD